MIPQNPNTPYDIKELIETIADENDFFELPKKNAKNIVIGFIRLNGFTVGVVANQPLVLAGCLDIDSSRKAARFVRFCDAFNIPIFTLLMFLVLCLERLRIWRIIKHGAKLLFAMLKQQLPK